jgi:hypothetical protein
MVSRELGRPRAARAGWDATGWSTAVEGFADMGLLDLLYRLVGTVNAPESRGQDGWVRRDVRP